MGIRRTCHDRLVLLPGKGVGSHSGAIEAGNDLIMPGGKSAAGELKKKLRTGELDTKALKRCAAKCDPWNYRVKDLSGLPEDGEEKCL